jgi:hypothetical protein
VVDRAGADLKIEALVHDRVTNDDVFLRWDRGGARSAAGARRRWLGGEAVELAGDAEAVGGLGLRRVHDGDAVTRDPVLHEDLDEPQVHSGGFAEDEVAAMRARGHAPGALDELRARVLRTRERDLDDLDLPLLVVATAINHTTGKRRAVVVAVLERAVQGDQREAREQAEDHVAGAAVGVRVAEDLLDAGDVVAVLRLLDLVHGDRDGLHDGARQLEADLLGRAKLAVAEDQGAQVLEVLEARDGAAANDVEGRVQHLADLDLEESVDELLGVADPRAREGSRVDELDQVVELERAVLRGRRGEQHDASAAGAAADRGGAKVQLPGAVGAVTAATHELGHAVLAGLRHVQVLEACGLVDDEHVDADVVPGDAGVVGPVAWAARGSPRSTP